MTSRDRPWPVLIVLSIGFFLTYLDMTIVNIAIPSIARTFHASLDQVLWVANSYVIALSALLIAAGHLGDRCGPRRLFDVGTLTFTLASVLCGFAVDPPMLIAARALEGAGAALLVPQTMTLIVMSFPANRRGAALGVWGAIAGVASIVGPTLGRIPGQLGELAMDLSGQRSARRVGPL
jgi:MFS family permease